jgi:hypothetical protein
VKKQDIPLLADVLQLPALTALLSLRWNLGILTWFNFSVMASHLSPQATLPFLNENKSLAIISRSKITSWSEVHSIALKAKYDKFNYLPIARNFIETWWYSKMIFAEMYSRGLAYFGFPSVAAADIFRSKATRK